MLVTVRDQRISWPRITWYKKGKDWNMEGRCFKIHFSREWSRKTFEFSHDIKTLQLSFACLSVELERTTRAELVSVMGAYVIISTNLPQQMTYNVPKLQWDAFCSKRCLSNVNSQTERVFYNKILKPGKRIKRSLDWIKFTLHLIGQEGSEVFLDQWECDVKRKQ